MVQNNLGMMILRELNNLGKLILMVMSNLGMRILMEMNSFLMGLNNFCSDYLKGQNISVNYSHCSTESCNAVLFPKEMNTNFLRNSPEDWYMILNSGDVD